MQAAKTQNPEHGHLQNSGKIPAINSVTFAKKQSPDDCQFHRVELRVKLLASFVIKLIYLQIYQKMNFLRSQRLMVLS
jgi:hypothetical protein